MAIVLLLLFAATSARSGTPEIHTLFIEGDPIPGSRTTLGFVHGVAVNDHGEWLIESRGLAIRNGSVWLRSGDPIVSPLPAPLSIASFGTVNMNASGSAAWPLGLDGPISRGLFVDTTPLLLRGSVSTAADFSPGTTYEIFGKAALRPHDRRRLVFFAFVDDPAIPGSTDAALVELALDDTGRIVAERVIAREGGYLPNQRSPVTGFPAASDGADGFSYNDAGQILFYASLGAPEGGTVLYLDDQVLAREGDPSIVPGRNWDFDGIQEPAVDLNNAGENVFKGRLDGGSFGNRLIVKNGKIFVREDHMYPDLAPVPLGTLGPEGSSLKIDDRGHVHWFGEFGGVPYRGMLRDHEWVARPGFVTEEGHVLAGTYRGPGTFEVSDNGRYLIFKGAVEPWTPAIFLVDFGPAPVEAADGTRLALAAATVTPNPMATGTRVEFVLRTERELRIEVLDIRGRRVRALAGAAFPAGRHSVAWNARADDGRPVAAGVYFVRLTGADVERTEKVTVVRQR